MVFPRILFEVRMRFIVGAVEYIYIVVAVCFLFTSLFYRNFLSSDQFNSVLQHLTITS